MKAQSLYIRADEVERVSIGAGEDTQYTVIPAAAQRLPASS